jgi:Tfp pilus assembly protein FimT
LIEFLIVLAILGVLLAVGIPNIIRENRVNAVRQVATQLQADLEDLRSKAIRFNRNASFAFNDAANSYTLTIPSSTPPLVTRTRTISPGLDISYSGPTISESNFAYEAPLSQITPAIRGFQVTFASDPSVRVFVNVIGVTGKAVISATN